ncbi:MAG: UDP-3-O-acyl-N-acetylglucosamine deacetylase [Gemmatimonadetes bacterium]|nr:UDP-3-O-acyl-N-acetylglucosamine deacetylase [Gemmatimonadota bacterium]
MSERQQTIASPTAAEGHGLHTAEPAEVVLHPAPPKTGIRFRRTDLAGTPEIPASVHAVDSVEWETALGEGEARVRTVEHILAAVHAFEIDNLRIDLSGPEPPALDGSAAPWCERIAAAGLERQEADVRRLDLATPLHVEVGDARYTILPHDGFRVSANIDFDHPTVGRQFASAAIEPESFTRDIAPARTFGLSSWQDDLNRRGLALGASADNTVALSEDGLEADCELRFPDEFARHKVLDIVGDLALVGARLGCHVIAERPGHKGNVEVARRLATRLAWESGRGLKIQEIMKLLPHRYPMLLVDRVLDFEEGKRIVGVKNVTANEPFFVGHFPDHPVMPGVLIVEALAQCGGLLLLQGAENPEETVVYLLSIDEVKFRHPVVPGDQLSLEIELVQFRGRRGKMKGMARVDGQVVAEATMLGQVVDR